MKRLTKAAVGFLVASTTALAGTVGITESAKAAALVGTFDFEGPLFFNANAFDFVNSAAPATQTPGVDGDFEVSFSDPGVTVQDSFGTIKDICNDAVFACDDGIAATTLPLANFLTFDDALNGGTASFTLKQVVGPTFTPLGSTTSVQFEILGHIVSSVGDVSLGTAIVSAQVNNSVFGGAFPDLETFLTANPDGFIRTSNSANVTVSAVPEPGTILGTSLFLATAGALLKKRRKKELTAV